MFPVSLIAKSLRFVICPAWKKMTPVIYEFDVKMFEDQMKKVACRMSKRHQKAEGNAILLREEVASRHETTT